MNKLKIIKLSTICFGLCIMASCDAMASSCLELVDVPTAKVVDYYNVNMDFRLYSGGGVISQLVFGVFKRLNLGFSWEVDSLIGTQNPEPRQPSLNLKFRLFDGSKDFPAIAIGYDGQGYNYSGASGIYQNKEKGIFVVTDTEILTKNLWLTLGLNMNFKKENNADKAKLFGFTGLSYSVMNEDAKAIDLILEYDNIGEIFDENRLNSAIRLYPANKLYIDFAFRDISSKQNPADRLIKINYQTEF